MNLRVDFILPSEQRSGSAFSLKTLTRAMSILVPSLLALALAYAVMGVIGAKNELGVLEEKWLHAEPQQATAIKLSKQLHANRRLSKEVAGWKASHIDWHKQLSELRKRVSSTIQLRVVSISQVLQLIDDEVPARVFTMKIDGKASGGSADQAVDALEEALKTAATFADVMDSVGVINFAADNTEGAALDDRVFQIECNYLPREFEGEPAGE